MPEKPEQRGAKGEAGNIAPPTPLGVEAEGRTAGEPPPPRPQPGPETLAWQVPDQTAAQIIAQNEERRRKFMEAATASQNGAPPLVPPMQTGQRVTVETNVIRSTIPIVPTLYPGEPGGSITVDNHITINIQSQDFAQLNQKIGELLNHLGRSNELSPEVRAKAAGEIAAGMAILSSPKPDPKLLNLLLIKPLKWLADKAGSAIIAGLSLEALHLLLKLMS
jgi:hypothetical protein